MAEHRANGRAKVLRGQANEQRTHRGAPATTSVVRGTVIGALAVATIGVPIASATTSFGPLGPAHADAGVTPADAAPAVTPAAAPEASAPVSLEPAASKASVEDAAPSVTVTAPVVEEPVVQKDDAKDDATDGDKEEKATEAGATSAEAAEESDAQASERSSTGYARPSSASITSPYGWRIHPTLGYRKFHDGVDYGAVCGAPAKAAAAGVVDEVSYHSASGNRVFVKHADGRRTGYFHLSGASVHVGEQVQQGEKVGSVGSTGRSTGCHLHFAAVDRSGSYMNPMNLFR